jgi:NitT/TauT family transport system substrate-binding protein
MRIGVESVATLLIASLLSACSGNALDAQRMDVVKAALANQIRQAPIYIADAEGYFAEYGIALENVVFDSAKRAIPLLVSGDVDVYAGTLNAGFLNTVSADENIRAVADRGHIAPGGCTYMAILLRKDLYKSAEASGPRDLGGLTFSGSIAGAGAYVTSTYLSWGGLTLDDIRIVELDTQAEIDAYANKAIGGGLAAEPDLSVELGSGKAVVLAGAEEVVGSLQTGIIAFNKKLLVDDRELGARFLAAYLKGIKQYNQGKTERNLQILASATGETAERLKSMCWPLVNSDGMIDFSGVDGFQQWSIAHGQVDGRVSEDQFWDKSLLVAAQALLSH